MTHREILTNDGKTYRVQYVIENAARTRAEIYDMTDDPGKWVGTVSPWDQSRKSVQYARDVKRKTVDALINTLPTYARLQTCSIQSNSYFVTDIFDGVGRKRIKHLAKLLSNPQYVWVARLTFEGADDPNDECTTIVTRDFEVIYQRLLDIAKQYWGSPLTIKDSDEIVWRWWHEEEPGTQQIKYEITVAPIS